MKTKFLFVVAMLMASTTTFAQFLNSSAKSSSSFDGGEWSTIYVQWNPSSYVPDKGDSESFTGLSIGYNKAFSISQSIPLFVEAGIGAQYSFYTKDLVSDLAEEYNTSESSIRNLMDPEMKINMISAKVPISLAYTYQIPDSKITLIPYVGIDFRVNIIGKASAKYNLTSNGKTALKQAGVSLEEKDVNLFNKDDMGSDDKTWNRFQVGWHIGLNVRINNQFLVGASYGTDFSEIVKKVKIHTASITVGYCF